MGGGCRTDSGHRGKEEEKASILLVETLFHISPYQLFVNKEKLDLY